MFLLLCGLFSSRGAWASHCHDFLCCGAWALGIPGFCSYGVRAQQLQLPGSRATSSIAVSHGLCCSTACGIFPDQGLNPCPLHWQADSYPLDHQESTMNNLLIFRPDKKKLRLRLLLLSKTIVWLFLRFSVFKGTSYFPPTSFSCLLA